MGVAKKGLLGRYNYLAVWVLPKKVYWDGIIIWPCGCCQKRSTGCVGVDRNGLAMWEWKNSPTGCVGVDKGLQAVWVWTKKVYCLRGC